MKIKLKGLYKERKRRGKRQEELDKMIKRGDSTKRSKWKKDEIKKIS